jgi:PAS domain S-box-containing protein
LVAQFIFISPRPSWPGDDVRLLLFILTAFMIRQLTRRLSRALARAEAGRNQTDQAFNQLQLSEARIRSILENALDAVVGMDISGKITHWNVQAEKIFGYSASEAIGQKMSETIIPRQYREAHERGMKHYLHTGEGPVLNQRIEITADSFCGVHSRSHRT